MGSDGTVQDLPDMAQCPFCKGWFPQAGDHGEINIVVHSMREHPDSPIAQAVRETRPMNGEADAERTR
jgi:hypothetical protein